MKAASTLLKHTTAQLNPAIWQGATCVHLYKPQCKTDEALPTLPLTLRQQLGSTWQSEALESSCCLQCKGASAATRTLKGLLQSFSISKHRATNTSPMYRTQQQSPGDVQGTVAALHGRAKVLDSASKNGIYMTQLCPAGARTGETTSAAATLQQCPALPSNPTCSSIQHYVMCDGVGVVGVDAQGGARQGTQCPNPKSCTARDPFLPTATIALVCSGRRKKACDHTAMSLLHKLVKQNKSTKAENKSPTLSYG